MKVAYFLVSFPSISETFILNEIVELQRLGLDIFVFSIFNSEKDVIHKEAVELSEKTYYPRYFDNISQLLKKFCTILFINFFLLIKDPISYSRTFWFFFKIISKNLKNKNSY